MRCHQILIFVLYHVSQLTVLVKATFVTFMLMISSFFLRHHLLLPAMRGEGESWLVALGKSLGRQRSSEASASHDDWDGRKHDPSPSQWHQNVSMAMSIEYAITHV